MKMYLASQWVDSPNVFAIVSPYFREAVDTAPSATPQQVEQALAAAQKGAAAMSQLTAHDRSQILLCAADRLASRADDMARTITLEEGKPLAESRGEVSRLPDLLRLCAFEGAQLRGETLPLDAQAGTRGKLGFTLRI